MELLVNIYIRMNGISCRQPPCFMYRPTFHKCKPLISLSSFTVVEYIFNHMFNSFLEWNQIWPFHNLLRYITRMWSIRRCEYHMHHRMGHHIYWKFELYCIIPHQFGYQKWSKSPCSSLIWLLRHIVGIREKTLGQPKIFSNLVRLGLILSWCVGTLYSLCNLIRIHCII